MSEFVYSAINGAAGRVKKLKQHLYFDQSDVIIIGDDHEIVPMFCGAVSGLLKYDIDLNVHYVRDGRLKKSKTEEKMLARWPEVKIWESLDAYIAGRKAAAADSRREIYFLLANLRSPRYREEEHRNWKKRQLEELLNLCAHGENREMQLVTCIPAISEPLPQGLNAVAEREYEVVFRDKPDESPEKFVCCLEDVIRSHKEIISRTQVIRLDRVFGPGINDPDGLFIIDLLQDICSSRSVAVSDRDRREYYSVCYVMDAMAAVLAVKAAGQCGNIYHVTSWVASRFQIISQFLNGAPEFPCAVMGKEGEELTDTFHYYLLNAGKLNTISIKQANLKTPLTRELRQTMLWYLNIKNYFPRNDRNVYYGRMDRIREMELELLTEIDRICKENGIAYFLSAGTMLGAVRHQGFIPWDDDVDIGMLPEDYEKFLKVCPKSLSARYSYQNFSTDPGCHYFHDKIRIKDSWFSTKYAHDRRMLNGVYIDVFVYYRTSDKPFLQKLHLSHIAAARELLAIKWGTKNRKSPHPLFARIFYYVTKITPFSWLHRYHHHVIALYEKRNTHYRLDSTGFNLSKVGAVPDEWFHGTTEGTFCGRTFPILAHYNEYLSHSVHKVKRIDLGRNLFDETLDDPGFHELDLRGELFEQREGEKQDA